MKLKYLLCPQCGAPHFYFENSRGDRLYFKLNTNKEILSSKKGGFGSIDLDKALIACCECSWKGKVNRLKTFVAH